MRVFGLQRQFAQLWKFSGAQLALFGPDKGDILAHELEFAH